MISVVIPALNEGERIHALLISLSALQQQGHEIIVVDGGSEDNTCQEAEKCADRVVLSQPGRARQMNLGASTARGEWLWFLHADSLPSPDVLAQLQSATNSSAHWGWFDVRLSDESPLLYLVARLMNLRTRWTRIVTGDMGLFVDKALFLRAGRFPEIPLMEDIQLSQALKRLDRKGVVCADPLVTSSRRWKEKGIVKTILLMWRLRLLHWLGVKPDRLAYWYYR